MARIRSVKPELRTDLTVASWPREVRYAFVLLWGYLDDAGRGRDDLRLITADLFPLDRDVTDKKLDRWLTTMATVKANDDPEPPLCRYEVAGQRYLHAIGWNNHQRINRPTASRLPPCPLHEPSVNGSHTTHGALTEPLTEPSLTDSLPSRAPAEQGKEQGAGSVGGDAPPTAGEHTRTDQLLDQHIAALTHPPTNGTIGKTRAAIFALIRDGRPDDCITAGLTRMRERSLSLSLLPDLVDEAIPAKGPPEPPPKPPHCGRCDPRTRLLETDAGMTRCPDCHPATVGATP